MNNDTLKGPYYLSDRCLSDPRACQGAGVLSVILSSFQGKLVETNRVNLSWTSTYEYNNSSFDIERSENGINWIKIGAVKSVGRERTITNYSCLDHQPLSGKNMYRLKQIDLDGNFSYSDIVHVDVSAQSLSSYSIYPNPAKDKITLYSKSRFSQGTQAQLFHQNGMLLVSKLIQTANAQNLDISKYSGGLYFLRIVDNKGNTLYTHTVIKN